MKKFLFVIPSVLVVSQLAFAVNLSSQITCNENVIARNGRPQEPERIGTTGLDRKTFGKREALGGLWDSKKDIYSLGFTLVTDNTVKVDLKIGNQVVNEGFVDLEGTPRNRFLYTAYSDGGVLTVQASCKLN